MEPADLQPNGSFALLLVLGGSLAFLAAYGFFLVFERPFLHIRSWSGLRDAAMRQTRRFIPTASFGTSPAPVTAGADQAPDVPLRHELGQTGSSP